MFWAAIAIICLGGYWSKVQKAKLRYQGRGTNRRDVRELKKKVHYLLEENKDLKEEVEDLKDMLGVSKDSHSIDFRDYKKKKTHSHSIELSDFEKEQIRLDNQNKFNY